VAAALFAVISALANFPILDTMFGATSQEAFQVASALTARQIDRYRSMVFVDFFYAVAYTALFVSVLRLFRLFRPWAMVLRKIGAITAVRAGIFDWVENSAILLVLSALPEKSWVIGILGPATTVKWTAVAVTVVIIAVLAITRRGEP